MPRKLWTPPETAKIDTALADFAEFVKAKTGLDWRGEYDRLWQWSVADSAEFWECLWDWHGIIGDRGEVTVTQPEAMLGGQFFPQGRLNYAENLLAPADPDNDAPDNDAPDNDDSLAIIALGEDGRRTSLTRKELRQKTLALAGWLAAQGVGVGDRVAAYTANTAEAIITLLATATLGGVFSSCSPDFGVAGAVDRFGQITPKILMASDGYHYNGKAHDRMAVVAALVENLPSVQSVLIAPILNTAPNIANLPQATLFDDACAYPEPMGEFLRLPFNHPLYILYSSGTTGVPKCITHGAGGTLLQHIKEHRLHCDIRAGDRVFYFTTCGWMMWNWLVSALAVQATVVLYDGNPAYPTMARLWEMAAAEGITLFGTGAKYLDVLRKSGYRPIDKCNLSALRQICSTGSPLSADGFDFVYSGISETVHLASIAGGTDLVSCFILGCPTEPVYAGEIQVRGLGMAVAVFDDAGQSVVGEEGELVCTKPFPSMPIGFWNDADGRQYRAAYFDHFPDIWRHGDWATLTPRGSMIIHGRSDATLNPGGVRIGTAEIYRQVEGFVEVAEALVIGRRIEDDVEIILFVKMAEGSVLDDALRRRIIGAIRQGASPRHVPKFIIAVADIPRTRSGKITELAVRNVVEGRAVKNTEALANPEALELFRNLPELKR